MIALKNCRPAFAAISTHKIKDGQNVFQVTLCPSLILPDLGKSDAEIDAAGQT
jgi:hypothetical protein